MATENKPVLIYSRLVAIEAQKGGKHFCDAKCKRYRHMFRHDFDGAAQIWGLPDGSIHIVSTEGKNLWKMFET